jgi:hypothetical protein
MFSKFNIPCTKDILNRNSIVTEVLQTYNLKYIILSNLWCNFTWKKKSGTWYYFNSERQTPLDISINVCWICDVVSPGRRKKKTEFNFILLM